MRLLLRFAVPCLLAIGVAALAHDPAQAQARKPNILLIVSDDLGYADFGMHGSREMRTPNIDLLAREGIRFTDAYVSAPYCSPTRAALLTGRYQQRFGHEFNIEPGQVEGGLPLSERTMADRLKAAGYRTAVLGKWHLGTAERFHPLNRGFDYFFGFLIGGHSYTSVGTGRGALLDGKDPAASIEYLTDTLADRASAFIKQHAAEPFFLYLAFNAAHTPMEATEKYLSRFTDIQDERRRTYAAMLSAMDDGIGRTLATLREQKLEQDTLIIYVNDNGGPTMATTTVNGASNAPFRGSKRTTWEGGIRVPLILTWKGRLPEGRVEKRVVIQLDVLPTVLAAAGVSPDPAAGLDGVNLLPFLEGTRRDSPHDALYWRLGGMMAIRQGDWKLVKSREGPFVDGDPAVLSDLSGAELFNLAEDVGEKKNLAAVRPDKVKELSEKWQAWNRQLAKPLWEAPRGAGGAGDARPASR